MRPEPTELDTLSLHDALPISRTGSSELSTVTADPRRMRCVCPAMAARTTSGAETARSEEHTSELQSHVKLVCRLLLEKKKAPRRRRSADPVWRAAPARGAGAR